MPLFPETFEDLEMIYTKLNPKSGDEEDLLDELSSERDSLYELECDLRSGSEEARGQAEEAGRYCEELAELSGELSRRVKYDQHLAIFRDEFAWYASRAAALSAELEAYAEEMTRYCDAASHYRQEVEALRRLVAEYGAGPHDGCDHAPHEYCDKYGQEWVEKDRDSGKNSKDGDCDEDFGLY